MLDRDELLELIGELATALSSAEQELELLKTEGQPADGGYRDALRERAALAATLKRLPPQLREKAKKVYREELARVGYVDAPEYKVTVAEEPVNEIKAAFERLRAAGLVDRDVWELDSYGRLATRREGC